MSSFFRYIANTFIWLIILAGIIVAGLRFTMANVDLFRADIESWIAAEIVPGISFGEMRCYWIGVNPVLELETVAITLPDRRKALAIDAVNIQFNLWGSLVLGIPVVAEISGNIETVTIRKDLEERWWFNDIHLVAEKSSGAASDIENLLASIPHYLQVGVTRLIIEDQISNQNYQIDNISADIQHHDNATHLRLLANLPENLGGQLKIESILEQENGLVYFQSEQLLLEPLARLIGLPTAKLGEVELSGEAWLRLSQHHIQGLDANISIDQASYQHSPEFDAMPFRLSLQMNATRYEKNWMLNTRFDGLSVDQQALPAIDSQIRLLHISQSRQLEGWFKSFELQPYLPIIQSYLAPELAEQLLKSEAQGRMENIWFSLPADKPADLRVSAKVLEFRNKAVGALPGIDKINANIIYGNQQARVSLQTTRLELDFSDQFIAPFKINDFNAVADARFDDEGITVSIPGFNAVNDDIKVAGRIWIEVDQADTPFMSLRLEFDDGIGSQKSKYLPVKLLPESALNWINEGIRSVDISNGGLLFHGRLEDIEKLDRDKSGELLADFDVDNAEVMFERDWAAASKGKGRLMFHNLGVDIRIDSVNYQGIKNAKAKIRVPTFLNSVVIADIDAGGPTAKALPTWLESPVGEDYREIASNLSQPGGHVTTNIKLSIPLEGDKFRAETKVIINFDNASINASNWGLQLSGISGRVFVDNDTITANGVRANYFDDPVLVDISTDVSNEKTLVKTTGQLETRQLLNLLPGSLINGLKGKSPWKIDLAIENKPKTGDQPVLSIHAESSLVGTAVSLPVPFNKNPGVLHLITGNMFLLANDEIAFDAKYGAQVKIRGRLEKAESVGLQLADLDIGLGSRLASEQASGIRLYGKLPKLPLDEWIAFYRSEAAKRKQGSRNLLPLLQSVDLNVTEVTVIGRKMDNADFLLEQSKDGFVGNIDSSIVKGKFDFPTKDSTQNPVLIDLEYARIAATSGKNQRTGLLPSDMFNMRMRSKEFVYDDKVVTDFVFDASIDGQTMLIDTLVFHRDDITFKYNGYWLYSPQTKQHETLLNTSIKGSKFGQTMAKLNFGDTIHNGTIKFKGEIGWPDELFKPDWNILSGKGRVRLDDGILKDVEPGSGRFVGLLSLNSLPRRLSLDFSDVLFDGMEFDDIKGDLVLDGQNLFTSNTKMDGPAAEITITGRTGMRDRDYDQKIYIVPKIRQTLPLIGSIAAGSTVGWGLLLLQNLFKSSIDESVAFEYIMTGSWDDPQLKLLNEPPPEPSKEEKNDPNLEK